MNLIDELYPQQRLLGNIISDPNQWYSVASDFSPDLFTDPVYQAVAEAIITITKDGGKPSSGRLYNELRKRKLDSAADIILKIIDGHITKKDTRELMDQVVDMFKRRTICRTLEMAATKLRNDDRDTDILITEAQRVLLEAFDRTSSSEVCSAFDVSSTLFAQQDRIQNGEVPPIYPLSLPKLQTLVGGFEEGSLNIIAARPSMGKTALMLQEALGWAKNGIPGLVFSLEQNRAQIGQRLIANLEGIPLSSLRYRLSDRYRDRFNTGLSKLSDLPLQICDKRGLTVEQLCSIARVEKLKNPDLKFICVDYLTALSFDPREPHYLAVGNAALKLRNLAEELGLFIVLLSQLNRGVETRINKRPEKSDLRDSGNIEEYADCILMLYREGYYFPDFLREPGANSVVEIEVAKNRQGGNDGLVSLALFLPHFMRWENCPHSLEQAYNEYVNRSYSKSKRAG